MIRELPRQGLSISEISRQAGHDRRAIRKMPDDPRHPAPYERRKGGSNRDPYKPYLRRQTAAGVLNAVELVQEVRRQDYTGGITLFRQFLHPLQPLVPVVTQRLKTPPGHQRQVDWAPCGLDSFGTRTGRVPSPPSSCPWAAAVASTWSSPLARTRRHSCVAMSMPTAIRRGAR